MNVLFMTLLDFSSIDVRCIYTDLMRCFVEKGHHVHIISPLEKRKNSQTLMIDENNCKILKLQIGNIQKTGIIEKGITTLTLQKKYIDAIKKYFVGVKFDLVIYSTPPITLYKAVNFIKKRDNAKAYLMLKDVFPQNAVDLGMLKKSGVKGLVYKYFRSKEKKLYKLSDYIGCMSKANVDYILKNNPDIPSDKVEICPNSVEPVHCIKDCKRIIETANKYNIPSDKTVFIYGGNIGKPQGVNFLIDCLKANIKNEKVFFVIAGSGTEFGKLLCFIADEKPENVLLIKEIPVDEYETLVKSCDVGLIFLDNRFTIPNFPSRLLSYMQAAIPVLAATDINTDIRQTIEEGDFGLWCESGDLNFFNTHVNKLCDKNLRMKLGENARRYFEKNFTSELSYKIIMQHFNGRDK